MILKLVTVVKWKLVICSILLTLGIRETILNSYSEAPNPVEKIVGQLYEHQHQQYLKKNDNQERYHH